MKRSIPFLFAICFLFYFIRTSLAQENPEKLEIGVVEHLDNIIPLNLHFTDDHNQPVILEQVINKPTVLILVYFDCPGICPAILGGVSDVVEKSDMELGKDYQIVCVSFNPLDGPIKAAAMKKNFLREKSKVHEKDWMYLTGDSLNIYSLTEAVGFKFKKNGLDFIHPALITVLSPKGKITRYLYGTRFLPFDLKMAIIEAQKGQSRPTINRVLEFCFSYDPEGRRYTLQVTKIAATVIIFLAIVLFVFLLVRPGRTKKKVPAEDSLPHQS
jgi:protein SCO1/2